MTFKFPNWKSRWKRKQKISCHEDLSQKQIESFDRFLIDGTNSVLKALEGFFSQKIDNSSSRIEISYADNNTILENLGRGTLYTVKCNIDGDLRGSIILLLRSMDFKRLSDIMKPILSLLFLSSPDTDLAELESQKPHWMKDSGAGRAGDTVFYNQMMDLLAEMGNVLVGVYTKSIYQSFDLNTHHGLPEVLRDIDQREVRQYLALAQNEERVQLAIENEIEVMDQSFKLCCLMCEIQ